MSRTRPCRPWRVIGLLSVLAASAAAQVPVSGTVFADRNGNGARDPGEPGLAGVAVSNQVDVATSDGTGAWSLPSRGTGVVFVTVPDGYRAAGRFWHPADSGAAAFALTPAGPGDGVTFLHASDVHLQASTVPRMDRLRALIDSVRPAFVLVTGDLVRDALRVPEQEARQYYDLYRREAGRIAVPVWNVPGNHELFGIERHLSLVSPSNPLYGRGMYRAWLGPDYYSFTTGGVHFVALNTVDQDDLWYYGHVDSTQLRWLERDLAQVPAGMPVVTFNHIPLASAVPALWGYNDDPPAPTLVRVGSRTQFRHVVSNLADVLRVVGDRPWPLALAGHDHLRQRIEYVTTRGTPTRFEQAAAVVGPGGPPWLPMPSGVTVYRIAAGMLSEGVFVPMDAPRR